MRTKTLSNKLRKVSFKDEEIAAVKKFLQAIGIPENSFCIHRFTPGQGRKPMSAKAFFEWCIQRDLPASCPISELGEIAAEYYNEIHKKEVNEGRIALAGLVASLLIASKMIGKTGFDESERNKEKPSHVMRVPDNVLGITEDGTIGLVSCFGILVYEPNGYKVQLTSVDKFENGKLEPLNDSDFIPGKIYVLNFNGKVRITCSSDYALCIGVNRFVSVNSLGLPEAFAIKENAFKNLRAFQVVS